MFLDLLFDATRENGIYGRELDTTTMRKQFFGFGVTKGLKLERAQKNFSRNPSARASLWRYFVDSFVRYWHR